MPMRIVSPALTLAENLSIATEHDDVSASDVHEFHTGYVPKAQHAATAGPLDRMETTPPPPQQIQVRQLAKVTPQTAGFYEIKPEVIHWVQKYTRTVEYH